MLVKRLSAIGHCPRKASYMERSTGTQVEPRYEPRLVDGWLHEYEVKYRLSAILGAVFEAGLVSDLPISWLGVWGHADGVVVLDDVEIRGRRYTGRYLLEVKSMAEGAWWQFVKRGIRQSHPQYYDQVQAYLNGDTDGATLEFFTPLSWLDDVIGFMREANSAWLRSETTFTSLPTMALLVAKNKTNGILHAEVIYKDEVYAEQIVRRWADAWAAHSAGDLPERLYENDDNFECRECPFAEPCWNGSTNNSVASAPIAVDDPLLLDAAAQYYEARTDMIPLQQAMNYAREILVTVDGDNVRVGRVTIHRADRTVIPWAKLGKMYIPEAEIKSNTNHTTVTRLVVQDG